MKFYTGIGSRETPTFICLKMTEIARALDLLGYCLRSGGAEGADHAFEIGALNKKIFLPWDGFNNKHSNGNDYIAEYSVSALEYVYKYHPRPHQLTPGGLKSMERNTYQVLGESLQEPSEFILCWTEDGKLKGGTSQALRIANDYKIPIFNFGSERGFQDFANYMIRSELFD